VAAQAGPSGKGKLGLVVGIVGGLVALAAVAVVIVLTLGPGRKPDAVVKPTPSPRREAPAAASAAARSSTVTLTSVPTGAEVWGSDGLRLGTTPIELKVGGRSRRVTLQLKGHERLRHRLKPGDSGPVELKLTPTKRAPRRPRKPKRREDETVGDLMEYGP